MRWVDAVLLRHNPFGVRIAAGGVQRFVQRVDQARGSPTTNYKPRFRSVVSRPSETPVLFLFFFAGGFPPP